jgi:tetratricopeptide (TPR) repeat protein
MALLYSNCEDFRKAAEWEQKAEKPLFRLIQHDEPRRREAQDDLAIHYLALSSYRAMDDKLGDSHTNLNKAQEVLDAIEKSYGHNEGELHLLASLHQWRGLLYLRDKEKEKARIQLAAAARIWSDLKRRHPDDETYSQALEGVQDSLREIQKRDAR